MSSKQKIETQYLDFAKGWMTYERDFSCVGKAVLIKEKGRPWSSWYVSSVARQGEEWKFKHAQKVHGKDPSNKNVPPKQVPLPMEGVKAIENMKKRLSS